MTDPRGDEWTDTPTERPLTNEPGIADDVGPGGGATPTDLATPGGGSDEVTGGLGPIDPGFDSENEGDDASIEDEIGLASDDEILR